MDIWRVGSVTVCRVAEQSRLVVEPQLLFPATQELVKQEAWLYPAYSTAHGDLVLSVHAFVIESHGHRILVDACVGNLKCRSTPMWNLQQTRFMEDLSEAGYAPLTIDTVICTHLHVDHVGWNTQLQHGRWVPTFPNARYIFVRSEWEHWMVEARLDFQTEKTTPAAQMLDVLAVMEDSVLPIAAAGLHELVDANYRITKEISLMPAPGHTPGQVCVHIHSCGEHAVITGDLIHHPLQCAYPHMSTMIDWDPVQSVRTRKNFLQQCSTQQTLVLGTHFASPCAGRIASHGGSWRFVQSS